MMCKMMRVELYLPDVPCAARIHVLGEIALDVGGYTQVMGNGVWLSPEKESIQEQVHVITTFMEDSEDNRLWLETLMREYRTEAEQESVLYVINTNEVTFIED